MHLLPVTGVALEEGEEAVDLGQSPGDVVALSFTDSDLAGLAAAHAADRDRLPSLRLANLKRLRHPLSVDLYAEKVVAHARFVIVRCLGGLDYWAYGLERLQRLCRDGGIPLVVLPGDERPDPRLADVSTVAPVLRHDLDTLWRAGGIDNLGRLLRRIAREIGADFAIEAPAPLPRACAWSPEAGVLSVAEAIERLAEDSGSFIPPESGQIPPESGQPGVPVTNEALIPSPLRGGVRGGGRDIPSAVPEGTQAGACQDSRAFSGTTPTPAPPRKGEGKVAALALVLFYRSALLSGDTAPIAALIKALRERGIAALPLAVSSLKDPDAVTVVAEAVNLRCPDLVIATTAFSARDGAEFVLDRADVPVIQALQVGAPRHAWAASERGLGGADLAMQVVLPEFDGRIVGPPIAYKEEEPEDPDLAFARRMLAPDPEGIAALADQASAWIRLGKTPRAERRLALVMSDYPARGGRAGFAVGLDTPASACAILDDLAAAGYNAARDFDSAELMRRLTRGEPAFQVPLAAYRAWFDTLPTALQAAVTERWGAPADDPAIRDGAFAFRAVRAGRVLVALQPPRAPSSDRKASYHALDEAPGHGYLAFHWALREIERIDALIHLGTHGSTEWLPGKAVALSAICWPRVALGGIPVVYPFIVNDPGEAAPAKRRLSAVTVGHLTPPVSDAGLHGEAAAVKDLVEELSAAQVLDPRRGEMLARDILERAEASGLAAECGVDRDTPIDEALTALDAHLCDLAEVAVREGLHVFGRAPEREARERLLAQLRSAGGQADDTLLDACASGERDALLKALDGRFVPPGPAGSPSRGHLDALPTGRNLITLDPRAVPTRVAARLGGLAAAEVVRRHLQDHGDWPRRIVMDLWASPTMRSGGEDLAHALALIGVRPRWDNASTRVSGFEIVPLPLMDRPRLDVTLRISGAFRDAFPAQVSLFDQAVRAVAALDEDDDWNMLAAARRRGGVLARVFGAPPGRFGTGVGERALSDEWTDRQDLAEPYLAASAYAYGGLDAEGRADASFAERVAEAEAFVHVSDIRDRDILDGGDAAETIGGFAAAAAGLKGTPALYSLDTSRPEAPRARTLEEEIGRLVRGRLAHPRFIAGQLAHGYRGAAELAQAVDGLFVFAATTGVVSDRQFDMVFSAYVADESVFDRIEAANPDAAEAILERFAQARRRGLWTSRLNSAAMLDGAPRRQAGGRV